VSAHFLVHLNGGGSGVYSYSSAYLRDALGHETSANDGYPYPYDMVLPVNAIAGQPFRLHFELKCGDVGPVQGSARGDLSFTGLPAGTGISSCQGFQGGEIVGARPSSWGRVKILYR
jgi:hypothetical protein